MKYLVLGIFCILRFGFYSVGQFPVYVHKIDAAENKKTLITGNLAMGAPMDNLSWAWRNPVKCFAVEQKHKFSGNHVLYYLVLPAKTRLQIKVSPETRTEFSIYAYQNSIDDYSTVPDMKNCLECESDYEQESEKTKNDVRTVLIQSNENQTNVIIGIAGADGAKNGNYQMELTLFVN